jgi:hypothetical protein
MQGARSATPGYPRMRPVSRRGSSLPSGTVGPVRTLLVLATCAALGLLASVLAGSPFAKDPVTKAEIEQTVAKRPRGHVQVVLCNEFFVPDQTAGADRPHTWTCDTYVGPSRADAQNGPSYEVTVSDDRIESVRRVPTR